MAWFVVQIIGIICGGIGMVLTWIISFIPQWRVTILAENNGLLNSRIDGQWISRWDGLWVTCINQAGISLICNNYESPGSVTTDFKAGRVLIGFAIAMSVIAFLSSLVGVLFDRCHEESRPGKHCLLLTAGILYILTVVLILIPVSWIMSNILQGVYGESLCRGAMRIEIGEAIFIAWPTMLFLLIGGIILSWHCSCRHKKETCEYIPPRDQEMVCRDNYGSPRVEYI
ncbi:claudin-8-like [Bombina bombina]|uniref:claudin-8-like n=1 Tax=Bombina bombina TaxID=8345 RepID=UPI00235AD803|nr:claudin-8-like [Bombina bombina]